ncbi:MAG: DUF3108 domain-containing protein [Gammaproteobacteria bacterium]|jgi:hypothetical protein
MNAPRRLLAAFVVTLIAMHAPNATSQEKTPSRDGVFAPFTAIYELSHGAIHAADSRFELSRQPDGSLVYASRTEPVGLIAIFRSDVITERSRFRLDQGRIVPIDYTYRHNDGKRTRTDVIRFDWKAGKAREDYRGKVSSYAVEPGTLDRFLAQIAFMRDLAAGKLATGYAVAAKGEVTRYHLTREGEETIKTPAGRFETVRIRQQEADSDRVTTFWCAPRLGYLPVKVEQRKGGDTPNRMELSRLDPVPDEHPTRDTPAKP